MKRVPTLISMFVEGLLAPQLVLAQWSDAERRIGPAGPKDHGDWELEIRPLREE